MSFLFLPPLEGGANEVFSSFFSVSLLELRVDYRCNFLVFEELPNSVAREDYNFVGRCKLNLELIGNCIYANPTGDSVTKGATHSKPRYLLVAEPHTGRSYLVAVRVLVRFYSAPALEDSLAFVGIIRFVVSREWHYREALRAALSFSDQDSSRVSHVSQIKTCSKS